ncbi:hypothetical protein [Clostridium botulinum]|uniref:Uncharacterized protein n=1 Tax=Clostridium botulinum CFSAN001627 TaxID=1232189 RepID=M1ZT48_CLOBO|nr:hypothetical protein [Clostridium botulinum]EKN42982.1 hypothetical protein CFSAN001627_03655 [Clostridium botulinum CFSAN001627]MBY6850358.1 hypothetical protein [Clostridium botulinum]MBY6857418.1 hypothetical protein [Clostridium botulinum]MBY6967388.1 hypothetical protein [Clostridium botulinum]HBJ1686162.1 hypothetical protein [Clostridium botulinum]
MLERIKDNIYQWFCESSTIDRLEELLVYNSSETLSKLGMRLFWYRMGD